METPANEKTKRVKEAARLTRVFRWFQQQDFFWSLTDWPLWARESILVKDRSNHQRFKLFHFFVMNGMAPQTAALWARSNDAFPAGAASNPNSVFTQGGPSPKILRQERQLIAQYDSHQFRSDDGENLYAYFDMILGRVEPGKGQLGYLGK